MDRSRRKFTGRVSILGLGVLSGCAGTESRPDFVRKIEDSLGVGKVEDLYYSVAGVAESNGFYTIDQDGNYVPELSNKAQDIFYSILRNGVMPQKLPIPSEAQVDKALALFAEAKTKYASLTEFGSEETYDLVRHMLPMLRMYFDINAVNPAELKKKLRNAKNRGRVNVAPDGTITLPPGFMVTVNQKGYCMDSGLPAPGKDEKLSLTSAGKLIPPPLLPLYKAIMQKAYRDEPYRNSMQTIVWTLRSAGNPTGMAANVDRKTLQLMEDALPGGAQQFADYHNGQIMQAQLLDKLGKKIAIKTGGKKVNPFDLIDPKKSEQAMADLFKSHTAAMNQPVTGAVPQDNRDYQMISPTVATFSVGTSTLTPRILLANAGNAPVNIDLTDYVMQPARRAQRIAMYPSRPDGVLARAYPMDVLPEDITLWEKLKKKIDDGVLYDAARFLATKAFKSVAQPGKVRDAFLGVFRNSPAAAKLVEAMPIVGNLLAFYEAVSGKSWVNGRDLNTWERVASALGTIPGSNGLKATFKDKAIDYAQKAFGALGFATNQNVTDILDPAFSAYSKTYSNPLDFAATYIDRKINDNLTRTLIDINKDTTLSRSMRESMREAIASGTGLFRDRSPALAY